MSDVRIDIDPQRPPPRNVDACTFSPDGNHLATYSATEGVITIWNVAILQHKGKSYYWQNSDSLLKPRAYRVEKTSLGSLKNTTQKMTNVDFALSNEGSFVALSIIKLPQELEDPVPFELKTNANKFFTYVVNTSNSFPIIKPTLTNLKGVIKFSSDNTKFIVCDVQHDSVKKKTPLYVFSTRNWTLEESDCPDICDKFMNSLQSIVHPWDQVKFLKNSLLGDYFVCVDNWRLASLWSISKRELITNIRCSAEDFFLNDKEPTVFALSHNKKMLAAWTSKGALTIFSCEGGAILSSASASHDTGIAGETSIIWTSGDELLMIVNAIEGMQIRDVHKCAVIADDYIEPMSVFQPTGTGSYVNYSKQFPSISKADVSSLFDDNLFENEPPRTLEPGKGLLVLTVASNCVRESSNDAQSNFSITIVDAFENEIAKIIASSERIENVHYVPVSESNDKITFHVNKRPIFGTAHFGSHELHINELFPMSQVGKIKDIDRWEKIKSVDGGDTGSEIHIEAQFIPMACLTIDKNFTFSEQTIEFHHLYAIILWNRSDGSYDFDDRLARIFNFENNWQLLANFNKWHSQIPDRHVYDNAIAKHSENNRILATALVIGYMRLIFSRFKTEWESYVVKLREWIDNQLSDADLSIHLSKIAKNFVGSKFGITSTDTKVQPVIRIRAVTKLLTFQSESGSFPLTDRIAAFYGFETLEGYFDNTSASRVSSDVKVSAITAVYLKLVAADYRNDWNKQYERLSAWLDNHLGNAQIEADVLESAKKFILEKYPNIAMALEALPTIPVIIKTLIENICNDQRETGAFFINNKLASALGFGSEEHFRSTIITFRNRLSKSRLKRMDANMWATVFVLLFWRLVAFDYRSEWQLRYEISYRWLYAQFKARELVEKEVFKRTKLLIARLYEVDEEALRNDAEFEASFEEKKKLIQSGRSLKEKTLDSFADQIGLIRLHIDSATIDQVFGSFRLADGDSVPYVTISDFDTEWSYGETKIADNCKKPVWKQVFYIPLYDQRKKLKLVVNDYNAFFKSVPLGTSILDIEVMNLAKRDADLRYKNYVTGQLRFDVEFISLGDDYFKKVLSSSSIGLDRFYFILSFQRQTGSFEIDDRLAKLFNFSTVEELIQPFQENFKSLDKFTIVSAFVISFFKIVLSEHEKEWLTSYVKTENWITESINDIEVEEQLYEKARRYIITQFNIPDSEIQTDRANQDIHRILSYQTKDGAYVLDAHFAKLFGYESAEVARERLRAWFSSTSINFDESIYATAVFQWYFRYVLVDHRDMWADAYKKSSLWLSAQIGDKEVEEKLLERAREFVCDRYGVNEETLKKRYVFQD